jgi:hypothetical protein
MDRSWMTFSKCSVEISIEAHRGVPHALQKSTNSPEAKECRFVVWPFKTSPPPPNSLLLPVKLTHLQRSLVSPY